tara:strand:- start:2373 stop:2660 length:288 start_codon:yes stop_codon:yes gene_type:complete
MPLIKFKIEAEFEEADVLQYAKFRGYVEGSPMTKEDYVCARFKELCVNSIAMMVKRNQTVGVISTHNATIKQIEDAVTATISNNIIVTSEPIIEP